MPCGVCCWYCLLASLTAQIASINFLTFMYKNKLGNKQFLSWNMQCLFSLKCVLWCVCIYRWLGARLLTHWSYCSIALSHWLAYEHDECMYVWQKKCEYVKYMHYSTYQCKQFPSTCDWVSTIFTHIVQGFRWGYDYMACMDYMDPDVRCPKKGC